MRIDFILGFPGVWAVRGVNPGRSLRTRIIGNVIQGFASGQYMELRILASMPD
jgi:hypothetical protein